ncbi:hypothetical protein HC761_01915 [bacterium]|nr:hypothetical protein [bacterium]
MRETGVIWPDENNKLDFGDQLKRLGDDAKVILSRDLRAGIIKVTPEAIPAIESTPAEPKA